MVSAEPTGTMLLPKLPFAMELALAALSDVCGKIVGQASGPMPDQFTDSTRHDFKPVRIARDFLEDEPDDAARKAVVRKRTERVENEQRAVNIEWYRNVYYAPGGEGWKEAREEALAEYELLGCTANSLQIAAMNVGWKQDDLLAEVRLSGLPLPFALEPVGSK